MSHYRNHELQICAIGDTFGEKYYINNHLHLYLSLQFLFAYPHRWERETADKYLGYEVANFIKEELELIKRIGKSSNAKKVMEAYFKLSDSYHEIISAVKGIKQKYSSIRFLFFRYYFFFIFTKP